jgi:hypothetical protein
MTKEVEELLELDKISEGEIIETIQTYLKLVKFEILSHHGFEDLLYRLGVKQISENVFKMNEGTEYTLEIN